MQFRSAAEVELFAASVRGVLDARTPREEPALGTWEDERDDELAGRLTDVGWSELSADPELLPAVVAGAVELGRAIAPLHLVDEPTLGAPLAVEGRVRHGTGRPAAALVRPGPTVARAALGELRPEASLDGTGTLGGVADVGDELADGPERVRAWSATTLGYLAGLAAAAVDRTVEHVRSREQFGAPLGALPAVQARLADAGSARDGLLLVAWTAADPDGPALPADELAWAGSACREVTATAHQLHGAIGFALETGLHRLYRRAKTVQAWTDAVCRSALQ